MNLLKKVFFIYLILNLTFVLFVDSYDEYEPMEKYNGNLPNDNKTCYVPWKTSLISEPTPSCWVMCKLRCIIMSRTTQWRCKKSTSIFWENCHCCTDDMYYIIYDN